MSFPKSYAPIAHKHVDLPDEMIQWFAGRGITRDTIEANGICAGEMFDHEQKRKIPAIKFPYVKGGQVVNAKYRSLDKQFSQEPNAESCLYRYDYLADNMPEVIIVCEGELDALACVQAGLLNVTSVPNGAPTPNAKNFAKEFAYLESAQTVFEKAKKIILATDNDVPGKCLEAELARRFGVEKCYRVQFNEGCKDANDVLIKHGRHQLKQLIEAATPYPVEGIFTANDFSDLILHRYDQGEQGGVSTGWPTFDQFYTVKPGQMTIVTGIPGHGKSTFIDALLVNLARMYNWRFALFSPENWPLERHSQSFIEKLSMMPFDRDGLTRKRIPRENVQEFIDIVNDHFYFLMPEDDSMTIETILEKAKICIYRYGVNGIVIDPWNEVDLSYGNLSETQFISEKLGKIRRFARLNNVHIWIVAHPQKLIKDKETGLYKPPTMYEISGGANWRNKADVGICVHRPNMVDPITQVYVQKVRFREIGKLGSVQLRYCSDTGTYSEFDA